MRHYFCIPIGHTFKILDAPLHTHARSGPCKHKPPQKHHPNRTHTHTHTHMTHTRDTHSHTHTHTHLLKSHPCGHACTADAPHMHVCMYGYQQHHQVVTLFSPSCDSRQTPPYNPCFRFSFFLAHGDHRFELERDKGGGGGWGRGGRGGRTCIYIFTIFLLVWGRCQARMCSNGD